MRIRELNEKFSDIQPPVGQGHERGRVGDGSLPRRGVLDVYLGQQGWDLLNQGVFSRVYWNEKNPQWVLKITPEHDRGYFRLYSLSKRTENVHFLNVGRLGMLRIPVPGRPDYMVYSAMIERLSSHGPLQQRVIVAIREYLEDAATKDPQIEQKWPDFYPGLDLVRGTLGLRPNQLFPGRTGRVSSYLLQYTLDVKEANVMYRGDIPVFTDILVH